MPDRRPAALPPLPFLGAALLAGLLLACTAPPPPAPPEAPAAAPEAAPRKPAEILSYHGADWLEREGREELERPDLVLAAMDLRPGLVVAEIGAGTGFFSRRVARAVAPGGKVLANDIQPEMLALLKGYAAREGIANVVPVLGTDTDPRLPPGGVDRILLVDVYHEFQKPQEMLEKILASLAPGGTVTLVEYRGEGTTASHIRPDHRMTREQVLAEWLPAGFTLLDESEELPSQHLFVFAGKRGARPR